MKVRVIESFEEPKDRHVLSNVKKLSSDSHDHYRLNAVLMEYQASERLTHELFQCAEGVARSVLLDNDK